MICPNHLLFERGRKFERGLRPLSSSLPSPAKYIYGFHYCFLLERGQRGKV
jgi:hypothetical protein